MERRGGSKYASYEVDDNLEAFVVHPDIIVATRNYDGTPRSFRLCMELREETVKSKGVWWNAEHDEELKETARERTQAAAAKGWKFPKVGR